MLTIATYCRSLVCHSDVSVNLMHIADFLRCARILVPAEFRKPISLLIVLNHY